ncbi:MAG: farnesyl diphosphate synthase [Pseudomonadota bacterium]|nr:farnesyl diphosphate synthase [Pseudomonadota bacterium]
MSLPASVRDDASAIETHLERLFDGMTGPATRLSDAMRYATMNGGKRLRGCLVLAAARLAKDGDLPDGAMNVAASVECLHAYSLIHDDLPAMDDSDTRRGKPSCHIAFDEATAILAGDALQTVAFDLLAMPTTHADGTVRAALVLALAGAAGLDGMAGGQMLDLEAESRVMSLDEVRRMQAMKTGALIQYAAAAGGIHAGAEADLQAALELYARDLGLAFQIADDLLDYDGDAELLGKPAGQDADRGKGSFVVLMGLEPARAAAAELIAGAEAALEPWGDAAATLRSIARFAIERRS